MTARIKPPRTPWPAGFPDVVLHASESVVLKHTAYAAAKAGDAQAAWQLCEAQGSDTAVERISSLINGKQVILASAHAQEATGINAIPEALARWIGSVVSADTASGIVQINKVGHTKAKGDVRLARQAAFGGPVERGRSYFLVDDFIGQGGTLANLKGYIEANGGIVIGATALTWRPDSAVLAPASPSIEALRAKHGRPFEDWWIAEFGFDFEALTFSEARYLERISDADTVRARIAAAQAG